LLKETQKSVEKTYRECLYSPRKLMSRITSIFLLFFCFACQFKAKEETGGLISGHQQVDNEFIVTAPSNGTRVVGEALTFTLKHPYAVTVTGLPRLTLDIGGATRYANYVTGTGTDTLTFSYVVQVADNDTDGISAAALVDLNGGTLTFTGTQGPDNCDVNISAPSMTSVRVDTTAPTVVSVSAPISPATYFLGMQMVFVATMSENVTITGTPRLTLTIGAATRYANYSSGSGTSLLVFTYTPVSGDLDTNGIVVTGSIDANSGTLKDSVTNDAALTFAAPNTTTVLVDGNTPYVTAITPPANGNYITGNALDFVLTYSEAVDVVGTPAMNLTIGSTPQIATYQSGSGSTQLTFRYIVQSADLDTDGIAAATTLTMTGATIRDAAATNALNFLILPSLTGVRVTDNSPRISSFTVTNGTYYIGQTLNVTAVFDQAVTVTGTPRIPITFTTGGTGYANYVSGSGTTSLVFSHVVTAGTDDTNGVVITSPFELNGGTIRNSTNVAANPAFTQPSTPLVLVSGIRPTITSVTPPAAATYLTGQNIDFVVNFSENVTVSNTGNVLLALTVGSTSRNAAYLSGSGTNALTFRYTVVLADADIDGIAVGLLSTGAPDYITDGTSTNNLATLTFTVPDTSAVLVNATIPSISSVTPPTNATYLLAQNLNFVVNYSEAVTVTGTPTMTLTVGSTSRTATYLSGSGTSALTFRYTVPTNDVDTNGVATSSPLVLNGGTLRSANGVNASLTFTLPNTTAVLVDGDEPTVISTTVPSNSLYDINQVSWIFTVTFDQAVTVTNTPRWVLNIGGTTRFATYTSGSGTTTLTFTHTLNAADIDLDGIAIGNSGNLDLNTTGTIRDANTNNANLSLNSPVVAGIYLTYPGMSGWWDFDVASTISTVACGLEQCISAVTDKTGNSINLDQITSTARPEYRSSGFGTGNRGHAVFDGNSDFLNANPTTGVATIRTMVLVFRTEIATMTIQDLFFSSVGGTNARVQVTATGGLSYGGTAQAGWSRNGSVLSANATTGAPALAANTNYILVVRFSANQTVAATQRLGNTNFGGQIAEVFSFSNNALTDAQLTPIINYLNTKHGVY
jgi:large repetitive protein